MMKHTIGKIPLLAVSISLGLMLGTAATKPALAGSFDKSIVNNSNGQIIGSLKFTWDDANVINNVLDSYSDLTSFNYTDTQGKSFDLEFASTTRFTSNFNYNLVTGDFKAISYNTYPARNGFFASSARVAKDISVTPTIFFNDFTLVDRLVVPPVTPPPVTPPPVTPPPVTPPPVTPPPVTPPPVTPPPVTPPPVTPPPVTPPPVTPPPVTPPSISYNPSTANSDAQSIPESSSVVGLLVIAGLGVGMSRKKLSK